MLMAGDEAAPPAGEGEETERADEETKAEAVKEARCGEV